MQEIPAPADGNCLFHSFGIGMGLPVPDAAPRLRKVAVQTIATHADHFAGFLNRPMDAYLRDMSAPGVYGGHVELVALGMAFRARVTVHRGDGTAEVVWNPKRPKRNVHLLYDQTSEHYDALVPIIPTEAKTRKRPIADDNTQETQVAILAVPLVVVAAVLVMAFR